MKTVYVLGSLNKDLSISTDVFPKEGETVSGSNFKTGNGGKGLNQAIAAAKLGSQVKFLGAIGKDQYGQEMKSWLKENGVDVKNVLTKKNVSSGIAVIILNNSNNRIVLDLGANLKISVEDIDKFLSKAKTGDIFLTQLENNLSAIKYALKVAKARGMTTVLNPAPATEDIKDSLKYVDYLIPNENEYVLLKKHLENSLNLVITRGKDGCEYICENHHILIKAPSVKVVDTTGAGDCFVGAFANALANEKEINEETLNEVTKIASISVTRFGSSISSPTLEEVKKFIC